MATYCKCDVCKKEVKRSECYGQGPGVGIVISLRVGVDEFIPPDMHLCSRPCVRAHLGSIGARIVEGEGP